MPKTTLVKVINSESTPSFPTEALDKALRDIEDLFDRCVLSPNYILLGETALAIWEKRGLSGTGVDVGLPVRYMTAETVSTLRTALPNVKIEDDGFTYFVDEVPVRVKVIHRKYKFFEHLDGVLYNFGDYQLPNPFALYWKSRYLVQ